MLLSAVVDRVRPEPTSRVERRWCDGRRRATYLAAINPTIRPLFDRIQSVVLDVHPDVEIIISYDMPTFVVGDRRLHVAAWKGWVSLYGWDADHDGGLVARFPKASSGRGTLKITPAIAASITDDELQAFVLGALDPR